MAYVYEVYLDEINYDLLKDFLERNKIKFHREGKLIKIYLDDFYGLYKMEKVIEGIKANFSIEVCEKIFREEYDILEFDLKKVFDKKTNHLRRVKGRLIGEDGKAIQELEKRTGAKISITDRYLYIAGDSVSIQSAYYALNKLVGGTSHSRAFEIATEMRELFKNKEKEARLYL